MFIALSTDTSMPRATQDAFQIFVPGTLGIFLCCLIWWPSPFILLYDIDMYSIFINLLFFFHRIKMMEPQKLLIQSSKWYFSGGGGGWGNQSQQKRWNIKICIFVYLYEKSALTQFPILSLNSRKIMSVYSYCCWKSSWDDHAALFEMPHTVFVRLKNLSSNNSK